MKAVELVREELARINWQIRCPVEIRRQLTNIAKRAIKQKENARVIVSNMIRELNQK